MRNLPETTNCDNSTQCKGWLNHLCFCLSVPLFLSFFLFFFFAITILPSWYWVLFHARKFYCSCNVHISKAKLQSNSIVIIGANECPGGVKQTLLNYSSCWCSSHTNVVNNNINLVLTCSGVPVRSCCHVVVLPRLCISTQWSTIDLCWHFFLTHTLHIVRFVHCSRSHNCSSVFCGTFQEVMHWGKAPHVSFFFKQVLPPPCELKLSLQSYSSALLRWVHAAPPLKCRHCASKKNLLPSVYDVVATSIKRQHYQPHSQGRFSWSGLLCAAMFGASLCFCYRFFCSIYFFFHISLCVLCCQTLGACCSLFL